MMISVIIPVYNGRHLLHRCLEALNHTLYEHWECIVVDDGSTDDSATVARQAGARLVSTPHSGPAHARNMGALAAQGDILFFIDADVLVQPGAVGHVAATFAAYPEAAACFGSYDDTPTAENFLSQYRNLLHHYVHQHSRSEASTFWSGCGAVRRTVFNELGGFAASQYPQPSIEDIELGTRLRAAGCHIRLEKLLQVTHMKHWTARQMLKTDIFGRAIPWSRLILQGGNLPNELNLQTSQRVSTAVTFIGLAGLLLLPLTGWWGALWLITAVTILISLNRNFYQFLRRKRGLPFMLTAMPWHWLYFLYSGTSFLYVLLVSRYATAQLPQTPEHLNT
ncbi:MAG: glycosyltransferase [Anaerolineae bacterium]|nr:glycosyltransferase [Anaerolineae bacterium]